VFEDVVRDQLGKGSICDLLQSVGKELESYVAIRRRCARMGDWGVLQEILEKNYMLYRSVPDSISKTVKTNPLDHKVVVQGLRRSLEYRLDSAPGTRVLCT